MRVDLMHDLLRHRVDENRSVYAPAVRRGRGHMAAQDTHVAEVAIHTVTGHLQFGVRGYKMADEGERRHRAALGITAHLHVIERYRTVQVVVPRQVDMNPSSCHTTVTPGARAK